jgi:hypothetical protein
MSLVIPNFCDSTYFPYGQRKRYNIQMRLPDGSIKDSDTFAAKMWRLKTTTHSYVDSMQALEKSGVSAFDKKMITLTYREAQQWQTNQITSFCSWLKRTLGNTLISYAWVAELQERGAMHYHLMVYISKGVKIPLPDKPQGRKGHIPWPHGQTQVKTALKPAYLATYLGKEYQKDFYRFPKGARSYGTYVNAKYRNFVKGWIKYKTAPQHIKERSLKYYPLDLEHEIQLTYTEIREIMSNTKGNEGTELLNFEEFNQGVRRIQGKWCLDSCYLDDYEVHEVEDLGLCKNKEGYWRVKVPSQFWEGDNERYLDPVKIKHAPTAWLEWSGLIREATGWSIEGEFIESPCKMVGMIELNPTTWVQELQGRNITGADISNTKRKIEFTASYLRGKYASE